jgi:hypothetical protein
MPWLARSPEHKIPGLLSLLRGFPSPDQLTFRTMTDEDFDDMAEMLGDADVMAFYCC